MRPPLLPLVLFPYLLPHLLLLCLLTFSPAFASYSSRSLPFSSTFRSGPSPKSMMLQVMKEEDLKDDLKMLPEDHQVSSFFDHGERKRFFFPLSKTKSPLVVIVTPCTTPISWVLTRRYVAHLPLLPHRGKEKYDELGERGAGGGGGEEEGGGEGGSGGVKGDEGGREEGNMARKGKEEVPLDGKEVKVYRSAVEEVYAGEEEDYEDSEDKEDSIKEEESLMNEVVTDEIVQPQEGAAQKEEIDYKNKMTVGEFAFKGKTHEENSEMEQKKKERPGEMKEESPKIEVVEEEILVKYQGQEPQIIELEHENPCVYVLQVESSKEASYVHFFISSTHSPFQPPQQATSPFSSSSDSTSPSIRAPFKVKAVMKKKGALVKLKWTPWSNGLEGGQYCLVVSELRHYQTLCQAQGLRYGVLPPELPSLVHLRESIPSFSSVRHYFKFQQQLQHRRRRNHNHHQSHFRNRMSNDQPNLRKDQRARFFMPSAGRDPTLMVGCTTERWYILAGRPGEDIKYYVGVFLLESVTNATLPLGHALVRPRRSVEKRGRKTRSGRLSDGREVGFLLTSSRPVAMLRYKVRRSDVPLRVTAVGCASRVWLQVMQGRQEVARALGNAAAHVEVVRPDTDVYTVVVRGDGKLDSTSQGERVVLVAAQRRTQTAYPRLPFDTSVSARPTSCSSVLVEWERTLDDTSRYCLLLEKETRRRSRSFKSPSQCGWERVLRGRSQGYTRKWCSGAPKVSAKKKTSYAALKKTSYRVDGPPTSSSSPSSHNASSAVTRISPSKHKPTPYSLNTSRYTYSSSASHRHPLRQILRDLEPGGSFVLTVVAQHVRGRGHGHALSYNPVQFTLPTCIT